MAEGDAGSFPVPPPQEKTSGKGKGGRPPKAEKPAAAAKAPSQRNKAEILGDIEESLLDVAAKGGALLMGPFPLAGGYLIRDGEHGVGALLKVAAKRPKMLARLQQGETILDYMVLGIFLAGFGAAVAAQFGMVPIDGQVGRAFALGELAEELGLREAEEHEHDEEAGQEAGAGAGPDGFGPAPRPLVGGSPAS